MFRGERLPFMSHVVTQSAYSRLVDRLNRFPQGAPASGLLYRIPQLLISEREASLVAQLPIRPFSAAKAAASEAGSRVEADEVAVPGVPDFACPEPGT